MWFSLVVAGCGDGVTLVCSVLSKILPKVDGPSDDCVTVMLLQRLSVDLLEEAFSSCRPWCSSTPAMLDDTSRILFLDVVAVFRIFFTGIAFSFSPSNAVSVMWV